MKVLRFKWFLFLQLYGFVISAQSAFVSKSDSKDDTQKYPVEQHLNKFTESVQAVC